MQVRELPAHAVGHGWDAFVEAHSEGTLFHTTWWRDLLFRHFPHRARFLEARRDDRRVGVLPLYETRSLLSGKALYSVPYGVYGDPLAHDDEVTLALLGAAERMRADGAHRFVELRCRRELPRPLTRSDLYATFGCTLPEDPDECLGMIPRKSRATARQAREKYGLRFREAPGALPEFHRLFVLNKQKLGSPAFAADYFRDLLRLPRRCVRLHVVEKGGEILVAVLSILFGGTFNPYYSGSMPGADRLGASNFMYWQLMHTASAAGYRWFDFGRSRVDTGAYHFKRHMGFEPRPLPYAFLVEPGRPLPSINPSNPAFSLPRRIIRGLPYPCARVLGPHLMNLVP